MLVNQRGLYWLKVLLPCGCMPENVELKNDVAIVGTNH